MVKHKSTTHAPVYIGTKFDFEVALWLLKLPYTSHFQVLGQFEVLPSNPDIQKLCYKTVFPLSNYK